MTERPACYSAMAANPRLAAMAKGAVRAVQHRLGTRMRVLREGRKLTQEQIADLVGISQKYVSELERGAKAPRWKTLVAIAHKGFDIKIASLLFGVDEDLDAEITDLGEVLAGRSKEVRTDVLRAVELLLRAGEASKSS